VYNRNLHAQLFEQTAAITRQQHNAQQRQQQSPDKLISKERSLYEVLGERDDPTRFPLPAATNRFSYFITRAVLLLLLLLLLSLLPAICASLRVSASPTPSSAAPQCFDLL